MFEKFVKREDKRSIGDVIGFIGKGVKVEGSVSFDGVVRIDGHFKGEINSNGTLIVGEDALVEARLNVDTAIISGEIRGVISAKSRVELRGPGRIFGEIRTPTLIIGEGVVFDGNCVMTDRAPVSEQKRDESHPHVAVVEG